MDNTELIAVGWGTTYENSEHASDSLRQVTLTAINSSSSLCTSIAHDMTTQLCAGTIPYSGKDTCQGDSGGPLMIFNNDKQWEIQGVTSYGEGCGRRYTSGVYTRVGYYLDWINQTIESNPATTTTTKRTNALSKERKQFSTKCHLDHILGKGRRDKINKV
ncbi:unnamed protein product [Adineta steineri]|uniref:Peptidase S1 domain-containing protein n=1 Tax=Adineta steineri TaxID=433720 RepID=A0A819VEN2_9BILA|nr:unnamed protein product [Adineta steineri]